MIDFAYLNNSATTFPKSEAALTVFNSCIQEIPLGSRANGIDDVMECKEELAPLLGISTDELLFTSGATLGLNMVIQGCLGKGDHCVVDNRSHNSVLRVLHNMPDVTYSISGLHAMNREMYLDCLDEDITENTKLVCLSHGSNVTGEIYSVAEIYKYIKNIDKNIAVMLDSSQTVGLVSMDFLEYCDYCVFTAHKYLHAIYGAAVIVMKQKLRPVLFGGTGYSSSVLDVEQLEDGFLEPGTQNLPAIKALIAGLDESLRLVDDTQARLSLLVDMFVNEVSGHFDNRLYYSKSKSDKIGIVSVSPSFGNPESYWARLLRRANIIVRGGLHCSPTIHDEIGTNLGGTLRFSFSRYTTEEELEYCIDVLKEIVTVSQHED